MPAGLVLVVLSAFSPSLGASRVARSSGHATALPTVDAVATYPVPSRKIRHPCGLRVFKRSVEQAEMAAPVEEPEEPASTNFLMRLINMFQRTVLPNTSSTEKKGTNSTGGGFRTQLEKLRALKATKVRRSARHHSSESEEVRRSLLNAVARLEVEVAEASPMTVSTRFEIAEISKKGMTGDVFLSVEK